MQTVLLCLAVFVVIVGTVLVLSWYVSIHRQNVGIAHSHKKQPDFVYDTTTAEIEETREWMKKRIAAKRRARDAVRNPSVKNASSQETRTLYQPFV